MKVAINLLPITPGKTGIGYYAQDLFWATYNYCSSLNFLYLTGQKKIPETRQNKNAKELVVNTPSLLWEQLHMQDELRLHNVDIYHSPLFTCPIVRDIPSIITVHDLIPESHPEFCTKQFLAFYNQYMGPSMRASAKIITTSKFSKKEIIEHFNIPNEKIEVVYQGISGHFSPEHKKDYSRLRQKLTLPGNFVLYVGMIEPRKNIERLISSFAVFAKKEKDMHLILVGRTDDPEYNLEGKIMSTGIPERIHVLGYLSDDDLIVLYASASAFIFPSLFEGFGRPVIEAMASGVPVICSNNSSLPEVAGDAAVQINPFDVNDMANALESVIKDNNLRENLIKNGTMRAKDFTHQKFASRLEAFYEKMKEDICV